MTQAVIQGTFADLKTVKTRSVVQMVVEIPIEQGAEIVRAFGFPQPGQEVNVAVAKLQPNAQRRDQPQAQEEPKQEAGTGEARTGTDHQQTDGHKRFEDMPRPQQAGILCNDRAFMEWMGAGDTNMAAAILRQRLGVQSRADLKTDTEAAQKWDALVIQFRQDTGQMASDAA